MNYGISWTSIKTLLRLELRSRFGSRVETPVKTQIGRALNILFTLIVYAILVTGIYYLAEMFIVRSELRFEFLVFATIFTMGVATIVAIGNVVKNLYMSGDNELLLRFPVSGAEILIAKSIYCFLHNLVINAMLTLPFYIIFGVVTKAGAGYYFASIGVMLLSVLLPYFLANLVAIPVMMATNFVKNQFLLVLIILIGVLCAGFILYMTALKSILTYLSEEQLGLFSGEMIARYGEIASKCYPFKWYAMLLAGGSAGYAGKDIGLAFLYIFLMTAAVGVGAYLVTVKFYYKTILHGIETEKVSFHRKTPNMRRSVFGTLLHREFYLILRSFNYSFQYLAMAVAAPVMVYYCNDLASTMGKDTVGAAIVPGLTLMVIIIFVAIIVSFASTSVSREGSAFYHTKIIPVSYTAQVSVKLFLYALVGTASVVLSCIVVGAAFGTEKAGNLLTPLDVGCIFAISEMTVLSLTCLAIWADVRSPIFNVVGDGELVSANKNIAVSLLVGILVAVIYGAATMLLGFLPIEIGGFSVVDGLGDVYLILSVISLVILGASLAMLYVNLEKRYGKIAP
ncbi:MAG TPA: hypothetical protein IAC73_01920 [Candidatus Limadaptatus stercoripullorum]|uniref:Uncharacterized protein n=1 Tax=Candidatus Limadaptatus stercoripullorum TaxID=2840846 RepID=A0A9D1SVZ6_9FIRM|nr:hypothetical protein [Candidatus Limadaptatus stercoripullorum]